MLIEHINKNIASIEGADCVQEMANLNKDNTGIENWVIYVSSEYPGKRPRVKLAKRGRDTDVKSKSTVIFFDVVEIDQSKDHSGASIKIKRRVLDFLTDVDNNKKLHTFWTDGKYMTQSEVNTLLTSFKHY